MLKTNQIHISDAVIPEEIIVGSSLQGVCQGDGCNSDQGGCDSDATCGQDC